MGQDPNEIRRDIERTREEMTDTVGAIGYKADVPSRARDKVTDTKDRITGKVSGAKDSIVGTVGEKTPDSHEVKQKARRAGGMAQDNPLGLAIGATAVGFIAGLLIPSTRVEDEKLGEMGDRVREQAKQTGQEAMDRGKDVAQQAAASAKETAQESGRQHASELQDTAKEHAQTATQGH